MDATLTPIEQQLLDRIQTSFPLATRPYAELGKTIGISEEATIALLRSLKERQILRQISAIFQSHALGFTSALISFQVPVAQIESTAAIINAHPGVSHNYQRDHAWNLWFTLSVPQTFEIRRHVAKLAELAGNVPYLYLPGVRTFKRRVQFLLTADLTGFGKPVRSKHESLVDAPKKSRKIPLPTTAQRQIMAALQRDLPLSPTPFQELAERFQIAEADLFVFMDDLRQSGTMSRFAAMLRHRSVGFTANVMVVWNVPPDHIVEVGEYAAANPAISHCYERVTSPEWPYNLYTMIHGRSRETCQEVMTGLASRFNVKDYAQLYSVKEFKKQAVNYFDNRIAEWHVQWIGPSNTNPVEKT